MAFFMYGDIKKNRNKPGVCLRVSSMVNDKGFVAAMDQVGKWDESDVKWVKVKELEDGPRSKGRVILEVWSQSTKDFCVGMDRVQKHYRDHSEGPLGCYPYRVCILSMKEDPKWVCESDQGRGYVEGRSK